MRLTVDQSFFADKLAAAARVVSTKALAPALSGVLLQADEGALTLTAGDGSLYVRQTMQAQVEEPGLALLPAKTLTELIRHLPDGQLVMTVSDDTARIQCGKAGYTIHGMPAVDYPELPAVDDDRLAIDGDQLAEMIRSTIYAVATDELRPVFTGARFDGNTMVATDGARLALARCEGPKMPAVIIPARALREVERLRGTVSIGCTNGVIRFRAGDVTILSRIIDGQFPAYKQVMPQEYPTVLTLATDEILPALERAALFVGEGNQVRLTIADGPVIITASSDRGEVTERVSCVGGGALDIAFNVRLLMDAIRAARAETILFELTGPLSPARIRPKGDESRFGIVLPMRF